MGRPRRERAEEGMDPESAAGIRPHARQFVIGPHALLVRPDWRSVDLPGGAVLSWNPLLRTVGSADDVLLLGVAVDAVEGRPVAAEDLKGIDLDNVIERTDAWAGRWMLLLRGVAVPDVGGLLGLLYRADGAGPWASSSPALLQAATGLPLGADHQGAIGPFTRFGAIRILMPGQTYATASGEVTMRHHRLLWRREGDTDRLARDAAHLVRGAVQGFLQLSQGVPMAGLTGGSDSRKNAAAAAALGRPLRLFTWRLPWKWMPDADVRLPPRIAQRLGMEWSSVQVMDRHPDARRHRMWVEHTGQDAGIDAGIGRNYWTFAHGGWAQLGYPDLELEGLCYELASNYYYPEFYNMPPDYGVANLTRFGNVTDEAAFAETQRYWDLLETDLEMDRRDLLFWSYKVTTSYSSVFQEMDLWTTTACPANCRRLYATALSAPVETRGRKRFLNLVTDALCPQLADLPVNLRDRPSKRALRFTRSVVTLARRGTLGLAIKDRLRRELARLR